MVVHSSYQITVIRNQETFWSQENRKKLAGAVLESLKNHETTEKLNRWEHTRWCCYLLSAGWMPASPEQVRAYMSLGVERHSLQIARLHPCLCSWKGLTDCYAYLHRTYLGRKDAYGNDQCDPKFQQFSDPDYTYFQGIDAANILQTADLLRADPVRLRQRDRE